MPTIGVVAARASGLVDDAPPQRGSALIELAQNANQGGSPIGTLLTFALIGGAMYMLVIRPQRARARAVRAAQAALAPGSEVILTSGIYGTVLHVEQDTVALEVSPGVSMRVARAAVSRVVNAVAEHDDGAAAPEDPDDSSATPLP